MLINNINKFLFFNNSGNNEVKDSEFRSYNMIAKNALQSGNINEACEYFDKANNILGYAYCKLMGGNLDEALSILILIKNSSSAANWLISLINVINGRTNIFPTYLQIRSFYEQDLNMFIFYHQLQIASKIIEKNTYFENFNREIYKYTARVLIQYHQIELCEKLLKKSLDICYKDPETHYLSGELYLEKNEIENAKKAFTDSNLTIDGYAPALMKLKELSYN